MERAFFDWLGGLFSPDFVESLRRPALFLVVGLVAAIVLYLVFSLYGAYGRRLRGQRPGAVVEEAAPSSAEATVAEAMRALVRGDLPAFIRLYYRGFLLALDERSVLRFESSRTNWECWRELRRAGRASPALEPLRDANALYDVVIFGGRPASSSDCSKFRDSLQSAAAAFEVPLG